jgi:DNA polymerase III delta prime subunit
VQALEANLDANLAGQTLARRTIEKALATNIERHSNFSKDAYVVNPYYASIGESLGESLWGRPGACKQPPRPLFMHFSGPTGVGKSLMAELIAKSLLSQRDAAKKQLCGKLLLQMHQYSSRHPAHVEDHSLAIRKMVAEQLYHWYTHTNKRTERHRHTLTPNHTHNRTRAYINKYLYVYIIHTHTRTHARTHAHTCVCVCLHHRDSRG